MGPKTWLDRKRRATTIGTTLMAALALGPLTAGPIVASSGAVVSGMFPTPAIPWRTDCLDSSGSAGHGAETGHAVQAAVALDQAPFKAFDLKTIASAGATPEPGDHDMAGHGSASSEPAVPDMSGHSEASQEPAVHEDAAHADASHEPAAHEDANHADASHEPAADEDLDHTEASHEPAAHEDAGDADASHEPAAHEDAAHADAPEQESAAHGHGTAAQPIPAATRGLVLGGFGAANGLVIAAAAVVKRRAPVATRPRRDSEAGVLPAGEIQ